jgi:glycogen phosphorylase/synthase
MNKNFIAVGLLYRYGYFNQKISPFGDQISEKIPQKFTHLPITPIRDDNGDWITISLLFPGRTVTAKVWKLQVGRIPLYLLDTDIDENSDYDRSISHQLYGGDWENRLKQELLLGIGGIRMLRKIGMKPHLYHLNEGHAAFLNLERLRFLIQEEKLNYNQALEVLRASSLFTTHTPVPAGHDAFDESLLRVYLSHYPQRFNISWEKFVGLGRMDEENTSEKFSMSILALKMSQECNGVSRLHGKVSRDMFAGLYPGYFKDEIHISHVTNGVHYSTWTAREWQDILTGGNEKSLYDCLNDKDKWNHIYDVADDQIWNIRNKYRKLLYSFVSEKLAKDYTSRQEQPHIILNTLDNLNPEILTIGFARRFATYKRAHLLFTNPERLSRIVNDPLRPVRFIFAGKAHPNDGLGQELIKKIINWSKQPEFVGKIIFLDNYDAEIAKKMVQGVDIWLNTPTRPLEASGTSGEKCVMNGVLHLSVLDGWWAEGYVSKAGWALKEARTYTDQKLQDELDAETLYSLIENDIAPVFYKRNNHDVPCEWIQIIKKCLCEVAPVFTMRRMMNDYYNNFYNKMFERSEEMNAENYDKAYRIASWKRKTEILWENVKIVENRCHNSSVRPLLLGEDFMAELVIDTCGISPSEIGVELLFGQKVLDKVEQFLFSEELDFQEMKDDKALYAKKIEIRRAGVLDFAIRIFIKHNDLPHRTDFPLVKWG